ncbi:hypothetical protein CDAR_390431 [Caerostris darwini]|uniref:Uncharacterized protein n=1 Tax=Caerostris darwini TaxID=1538125 RepID=A0AAV4P354_9ARAC|nr:hypothetical protein CDAR_390431 [Caerostris darwini]
METRPIFSTREREREKQSCQMMWRYFCANEPAAQECCSASLEVDISIPVARHQLAHLASPLSLVTSRRSRDAEGSARTEEKARPSEGRSHLQWKASY